MKKSESLKTSLFEHNKIMNALIIIFYRIAAFFTRVPKKTREYNFRNNEAHKEPLADENGFIESQRNIEDIRFGSGFLKNNGCGPIATFNALNSLGLKLNTVDFYGIITEYEKKGAAFHAYLGTSPFSIKNFFKNRGLTQKAIFTASENKLNEFSKNYDSFISIIKNNAKSIRAGLHYICVHKDACGRFITHNPLHESDSIYDVLCMCSNSRIKHIYTIGIKADNKV